MNKAKLLIISIFLMTGSLYAQGSGIGAGLSTNGLNAKYWMNGSTAISAYWDLGSALAADYLLHNTDMLEITDSATPVYYGAGIGISNHKLEDESTELNLTLRGVVGLSYYLEAYPMDIYLE